MPTGYTAKLMEKGQTFPEFVLLCARAFGATILMRDDPMDKPIPEAFKPSDYNEKALRAAKAELDRLDSMGGNERIAFGEAQRKADIQQNRDWLTRERNENERLTAMRVQVQAWEPPSPEHVSLKNFMLEQIDMSVNSTDYIEKAIVEAEAKSPAAYYAAAVAKAARDVEYHIEEQAKEVERTESRNRWIRQLRDSLKESETA